MKLEYIEMKSIADRIPIRITADILPNPQIPIRSMDGMEYTFDDLLPCDKATAKKLAREGCEVFAIEPPSFKVFLEEDEEYDPLGIRLYSYAVRKNDWHGVLKRYTLREIKMKYWADSAGIDYCDIPVDATVSILPDQSARLLSDYDYYPREYYYIISQRTALILLREGEIKLYTRDYEHQDWIREYVVEEDPNFTYEVYVRKDDWEYYLFTHSLKDIYEKLWAPDCESGEKLETEYSCDQIDSIPF